MKKTISALVAISYLSLNVVSYAVPMDISKHWAKKEIIELTNANIMPYSSNRFRPDDYISRAELINAINNTFKFNKMSPVYFKDVDPSAWYYNDVKKALAQAYIEGFDTGDFQPYAQVTREEAAKIFGLALGLEDEIPQGLNYFSDSASIANWALVYASLLNEKGYMSGDEHRAFRPKAYISRGETAAIIYKIYEGSRPTTGYNPFEGTPDEICLPDLDQAQGNFRVQVASFSNQESALAMKNYLVVQGFQASQVLYNPAKSSYLVLAGPTNLDQAQAQGLVKKLKALNLDAFASNSSLGSQPEKIKVGPVPVNQGQTFSVQAGIFSSLNSAKNLKADLVAQGFKNTYIVKFNTSKNFYVLVDSKLDRTQANRLNSRLKSLGFESFITNKQLNNISLY